MTEEHLTIGTLAHGLSRDFRWYSYMGRSKHKKRRARRDRAMRKLITYARGAHNRWERNSLLNWLREFAPDLGA